MAVTVTADMAMVVMAITVVMVMVAITVMVTVGMAMETTITVMATTTVIMAMDIGTTGTMVTGMATDMAVGGGMGAGMDMGSEPAGPGRHMATGGFAINWQNKHALPNGLRRSNLGPSSFALMECIRLERPLRRGLRLYGVIWAGEVRRLAFAEQLRPAWRWCSLCV
jgi:hypothetical protein